MRVVALVAVKRLHAAKSRLASILDPMARCELARTLLAHMLSVSARTPGVDQVVVVTPEPGDVPEGYATIEDRGGGLNAAVGHAAAVLSGRGAREILVLPADLPFVGEADLRALIHAGRTYGAAVAPDRHGMGTNGLWIPTTPAITFSFGPGSCQKHVSAWRRLGVEAALVRRPGLAYDIDEPCDLLGFNRANVGEAIHA